MDTQTIFINNLKRFRKERKITQQKLAQLCNTDTAYIGQIEIGLRFPSLQLMEKIAEALNIKVYMLFMEETDYNTNNKENSQIFYHLENTNTDRRAAEDHQKI